MREVVNCFHQEWLHRVWLHQGSLLLMGYMYVWNVQGKVCVYVPCLSLEDGYMCCAWWDTHMVCGYICYVAWVYVVVCMLHVSFSGISVLFFHVHAFDFVLADTLVHAGISHTALINPWKRGLCCTLLISWLSDLEVFIKSTSILTPAQYNGSGLSEGICAKQIWLSFFSDAWVALGREAGQSGVQST